MFDPSIGQWLEEDPLGLAAGDPNTRRYVGNDPTYGVDPSGLEELPTQLKKSIEARPIGVWTINETTGTTTVEKMGRDKLEKVKLYVDYATLDFLPNANSESFKAAVGNVTDGRLEFIQLLKVTDLNGVPVKTAQNQANARKTSGQLLVAFGPTSFVLPISQAGYYVDQKENLINGWYLREDNGAVLQKNGQLGYPFRKGGVNAKEINDHIATLKDDPYTPAIGLRYSFLTFAVLRPITLDKNGRKGADGKPIRYLSAGGLVLSGVSWAFQIDGNGKMGVFPPRLVNVSDNATRTRPL